MNNLQTRKELQKKVMKWGVERYFHHRKCQYTASWNNPCNCNYTLDNN